MPLPSGGAAMTRVSVIDPTKETQRLAATTSRPTRGSASGRRELGFLIADPFHKHAGGAPSRRTGDYADRPVSILRPVSLSGRATPPWVGSVGCRVLRDRCPQ